MFFSIKVLYRKNICTRSFIGVVDQLSTAAFADAENLWQRQIIMIVSEGGVLTLSLLIGVWFLAASYRREVLAAQKQRNFLLSITHELKSPLASIKLVVQTF